MIRSRTIARAALAILLVLVLAPAISAQGKAAKPAPSQRTALKVDGNLTRGYIAYLASNIRSSIRRLEGALTTVISYTSLTRQPLTRETLERLLADMIDQEKAEVLPVEEIQRVVADHYDIRLADMTSPRRPQAIAFPRQVAMYLCRELTDRSLPSIGAAFGRNHATVLHACRLVQKRLTEDASLRQTLAALQHKLSRPR